MKGGRTGPTLVVTSLGMDTHDHPRPALQTQREKAVGFDHARRRLAVSLADGPHLGKPLGPATRRLAKTA